MKFKVLQHTDDLKAESLRMISTREHEKLMLNRNPCLK